MSASVLPHTSVHVAIVAGTSTMREKASRYAALIAEGRFQAEDPLHLQMVYYFEGRKIIGFLDGAFEGVLYL